YRNNGDATFTDVSSSAGISNLNHLSLCASFFDFNNDGWQDIYIANDRFTTSNILYKNNGNGTFTDVSSSSGSGITMDAMSTTIGDYNSDGFLDIYITNTSSGNYFLENNGDETFTNIASSNGTLFQSISWGAVFLDADNDSDLDLYVSGMRDGTSGQLPSAFYQNDNGVFTIPSS
ncbi:MAG: VCBS repeat-containing protein, partial [Bacteroidetes bacterium]|nr:VCBS repeat-containing protein [Bacteroidota bacterium]